MSPGTPDDLLERVLAFVRAGSVRIADAVRPVDAGLVLSTPSLPAAWSVNHLRVTRPLGFERLLALAAEELAGFDYRHVVVEDQVGGPVLAEEFAAAGWRVARDLQMILSDVAEREPDRNVVCPAEEAEVLALMARWHGEGGHADPDSVAQLVEHSQREVRVLGDRLLGVRSSDGRLVSITKLRSDGQIAQVEDVYTVPEARGRGYASALVSCAVELARAGGHDVVFITADDDDWPKLLYQRLGFRPLGRIWQFHRDCGP